ncbi:hypothetical protein Mapa_000037 [Marchantia paleacea]|nr:hypothetical protein Mapa_000037 [Marchantia paleacea]
MFLYSTVSTLNPMVGMVVTISPSFNLYKIVVFPAASRPTIKIRISFFENRLENSLVNVSPILAPLFQHLLLSPPLFASLSRIYSLAPTDRPAAQIPRPQPSLQLTDRSTQAQSQICHRARAPRKKKQEKEEEDQRQAKLIDHGTARVAAIDSTSTTTTAQAPLRCAALRSAPPRLFSHSLSCVLRVAAKVGLRENTSGREGL